MILRHFPFLVAVLVSLLLTLVPIFSDHHQLLNLEPYPDGLFYVVTGQSLSRGQGLGLSYQGTLLEPKIPPLYSLFLSLFYWWSDSPPVFYLANLVLSLVSLFFLYLALRNTIASKWIQLFLLILYTSHAYLAWFVTLPMAENMSLFLMILSLWCLTQKKPHLKHYLLLVSLAAGMVLTKYAHLPMAVVVVLLPSLGLLRHQKYQTLLKMAVVGAFWVAVMCLFMWVISFKPLSALFVKQGGLGGRASATFFNFEIGTGLQTTLTYLKMMNGFQSQVLWLTYPLSTLGVGLLITWLVGWWLKVKPDLRRVSSMIAFAFSPLLLLQFFYVTDGRYLLTAIPCLIMALAYLLTAWPKPTQRYLIIVLGAVLLIQIFSQLGFYRQIIASNWLLRSRAWQYESILEFERSLRAVESPLLITALPPYLVQLYLPAETQIRVLPLSAHQEFSAKKEWVWGNDVEYGNLVSYYQRLLTEGKKVYLSNAYISHSALVGADYSQLSQVFKLILVKEGCLGTCNLFKLELK